ncbi:DUF4192 domain-containing protein [Saccharopolyspora endophytica]|uniref:DUF4192 domain-containing protein n=1 Tax=Saccharopolyspora endophytica TaxID=543886 RepID=A0ABS5DQK1_9PSEU|nr:DUF4192 domain-containing protein [Saccharopolyspora endophytica]MBQ0928585.1 DUF4192 domain-containing protein [Saccharopolyspora endophytica]
MNDRLHAREGMDGPSDLLAAVPHLIGFYPAESLIVLTFHDVHTEPHVNTAIRMDLPNQGEYDCIIARVMPALLADSDIEGVVAIVTTTVDKHAGHCLPHAELVTRLARRCGELAVPLLQAFWTPEFRADAPWGSYADPRLSGTIADPATSALAVASALAGEVTYGSRAEMTNLLSPQHDEDTAARWSAALDALTEHPTTGTDSEQCAAQHRLVLDTIQALAEGGEVDEDILIRVLHAIGDIRIRDAVFTTALGPHSRAAERLWITLIRSAPTGPEVVEAAVLLTFSAYVRGHGTLAAIAAERALHADPDHTLARLLAQAMACGIGPNEIALIAHAATEPGPDHSPLGSQP